MTCPATIRPTRRVIDYDAKGQRTALLYGNGTSTAYIYDPLTFRLIRLLTTRGSEILQDLNYTYDPVGNITNLPGASIASLLAPQRFPNSSREPLNSILRRLFIITFSLRLQGP